MNGYYCNKCKEKVNADDTLHGLECEAEEMYFVIDELDVNDVKEMTLQDAKDFLTAMWEDDEDADFDVDEHIENIRAATPEKLNDYLGGCGYALLCNEEEVREFQNA